MPLAILSSESGKITLTFNKLKKEEPLFVTNLGSGENILRNLGANAGKLINEIEIAFK